MMNKDVPSYEKKKLERHGMTWKRIYNIRRGILTRCNNKNDTAYKNYWGRWIKCLWSRFGEFYEDMKWSYGDNLTIDRIDNDWNYCKENCRWISMREQHKNRRSSLIYKGKCVADRAKVMGRPYKTVNNWFHKWILEQKIIENNYLDLNNKDERDKV